MAVTTIDGIVCKYNNDNVAVHDSYKIHNEDAFKFCEKLRAELPIEYKRSTKSWAKEIIAHTILFNHNIYPLHCIDTDLSEHEYIHRLIAYEVIYIGWKLKRIFTRNRE